MTYYREYIFKELEENYVFLYYVSYLLAKLSKAH